MKSNQLHTVPGIIQQLAHLLGTTVKKHRLDIPKKYGRGYCAGYIFNEHIRMMVLDYELKEDIEMEYPDAPANRLLFKFRNVTLETGRQSVATPSVLVATSKMDVGVVTVHSNTATINIEVEANYLKTLLPLSDRSPVLQSLLQNTQPLLFEQLIYPSLQKVITEMMTESMEETFKLFFLKVKTEELICRLLMELEKLLEQLDTPPVIAALSVYAGMSPTKLKRLFKQIFGDSIFSYYQTFRMQEAARLLKEEKLSVSDVGYQLGFTNLSHFSRVFEEHIGQKPKQYSRS
jgi:AraC-like DNA-binding protein